METKRQTMELETEISLTNPLIVHLESLLTRRHQFAAAEIAGRRNSDPSNRSLENDQSDDWHAGCVPSSIPANSTRSGLLVSVV